MSRLVGWIGFFFLALSGFLPLLAVDVFFTKVSVLAPIALLAEVLFGSDIFREIWQRSPVLLYLIFFTAIFYILGILLGLYGLIIGKKQGTLYGGLFGLAYSVMSFISAYGIVRIFEGSAAAMSSAGAGVFSAFIGSTIMMYSARRRGKS